jgi:hypothetical protein
VETPAAAGQHDTTADLAQFSNRTRRGSESARVLFTPNDSDPRLTELPASVRDFAASTQLNLIAWNDTNFSEWFGNTEATEIPVLQRTEQVLTRQARIEHVSSLIHAYGLLPDTPEGVRLGAFLWENILRSPPSRAAKQKSANGNFNVAKASLEQCTLHDYRLQLVTRKLLACDVQGAVAAITAEKPRTVISDPGAQALLMDVYPEGAPPHVDQEALLAAIGEVVIITGNDLKGYLSENRQIKKALDLYNWDIRQLVAVVQGNNRTRTHDALRGLTKMVNDIVRGAVDPTALEKLRALRGVTLPKPENSKLTPGVYVRAIL